MAKIKIKRGLEENLPTLEVGELALTTDSEKVLVGTNSGNKELGGGGGIVINEWQELTLLNGFTGYIKVRKNALGQVELLIDITIPEPPIVNNWTTLPIGYRPSFPIMADVRQSVGGNGSVWIGANGSIYGGIPSSTTPGSHLTGCLVFLIDE